MMSQDRLFADNSLDNIIFALRSTRLLKILQSLKTGQGLSTFILSSTKEVKILQDVMLLFGISSYNFCDSGDVSDLFYELEHIFRVKNKRGVILLNYGILTTITNNADVMSRIKTGSIYIMNTKDRAEMKIMCRNIELLVDVNLKEWLKSTSFTYEILDMLPK